MVLLDLAVEGGVLRHLQPADVELLDQVHPLLLQSVDLLAQHQNLNKGRLTFCYEILLRSIVSLCS